MFFEKGEEKHIQSNKQVINCSNLFVVLNRNMNNIATDPLK